MITGPELAAKAFDEYSQFGEDGIIAEILSRLPARDDWCVEFGAWDGKFQSNTRALVDRGASAVMIEGDRKRAADLVKVFADNGGVHAVHALVGWDGEHTLDRILAKTSIPQDFDLLSVDIDGNDYHVWKAVEIYRPKVVVIEFNPTIPDHVSFVQDADPKTNKGSSARSLVDLAEEKGYGLVAVTTGNLIFLRSELVQAAGLQVSTLDELRTDRSCEVTAFVGFDGRVHLRSERGLSWYGRGFPDEVRVLPKVFDGFPFNFSKPRWRALVVWLALKNRPEGTSRIRALVKLAHRYRTGRRAQKDA